MERVVDEAARVTGIDRGRTAAAQSDHGVRDALQDRGRHHVRQRRFRADARQGAGARRLRRFSEAAEGSAAQRGKLRGIGISCFLEHSGAHADRRRGARRSRATAAILLGIGVQSTGQGHATIFPRLVASGSASRPTKVRQRRHRSRRTSRAGLASVGSRSTMTVGSAHGRRRRPSCWRRGGRSPRSCWRRPKPTSTIDDGHFAVVGTDRRALAVRRRRRARGPGRQRRIAEDLDTKQHDRHAADLPERLPHRRGRDRSATPARSRSSRYAAVDDCGNVLDHMLVDGPDARRRSRRASARRCWRTPSTTPAAASCHRLVHGLRDAARRRHAADRRHQQAVRRRPPIRSASRASAKPAPPARSPRS